MFITVLYLQFELFIIFQCPIALFPTHMHFSRENTAVKATMDVMEHTLITVTIVAKKETTWTAPRQRRAIPQVDVDLQFWLYINAAKMPTICFITLCFIYINRYLLWWLTCSIRWPICRLRYIQHYDGGGYFSKVALWILRQWVLSWSQSL